MSWGCHVILAIDRHTDTTKHAGLMSKRRDRTVATESGDTLSKALASILRQDYADHDTRRAYPEDWSDLFTV